jgi:nucleotide-binding universal stress UspA family protein
MYTKILVPLDRSNLAEQILPYAGLIAEKFHVPVELLRVNDPDAITAFAPPLQGGDYLKKVSQLHFPLSRSVDCVVEMGKPAETIVERAAAHPGTVITMATHGFSGMQRWLLGSVANKVVRTARNPVLLIRPTQKGNPLESIELKTLLVPLDGSGLGEKVLPHVVVLAKAFHLEVNLVRVYTLPAESYLVGDGLYMDVLSQERETIRKGAEEYLDGKTQELQAEGVGRVISIAMEGDAAGEIIDLARKTPDCLIAMSTHGRSGVERWALGSVAEKVIHHSKNPVLVIRPE